jgi:ADP-ribose pyrophosphatase YjhB (NUDIX family)
MNPQDQIVDKADSLYRISLKCLIRNESGEVLVAKETGRKSWDLPGGGMNHGENITSAIARELSEEVNLKGNFKYKTIAVDEPKKLTNRDIWQIRRVLAVKPENLVFNNGKDSDETAFMDPKSFENSESEDERKIYEYSTANT